MHEQYLATRDVARLLGISTVAVFKRIKSGKIKAHKIGRSYIINKRDVPELDERTLNRTQKAFMDKALTKTIKEYSVALKLLGNE